MRDYLLFAVSPTLLAQSGASTTIERSSVERSGLGLSPFSHFAAARGAAVEVAAVARGAQDKHLITQRILALDETRRRHGPPSASKKLDN
jgi:hypothetical protein